MAKLDLSNINDNPSEFKQLPNSSAIKKSGFSNFMSTLFGWRRGKNNNTVELSKVDIGAKEQRIGQALLDNLPNLSGQMSNKLEELFNIWLSDNTDRYTEIQKRLNRINQLQYMILNDPYANRVVELYADESTQLDQQDTIIQIDTPDPMMTKDMYALLNTWGVTQTRIRDTFKQMASFGDAFWANSVSDKGIEKIIPMQQKQVTEIIEFNPIKALELKKKRTGFFGSFASNNYLIDLMLKYMDDKDSFADMFDTKLFGYYIDDDLAVPAWSITHFRVGSDGSEFYPFGTPPLLGALAPYKQTQSAIALQQIGKELSFPITLYKVKTDENMDEVRQFAVVNRVRESYDNIGVQKAVGNSEVYTVNTKIWLPDNLLTVDVVSPSSSENDGVDDIKFYQDREAVALGIPKSFYGEEGWNSLAHSGKSLTQQYKPFARKCYSLQSAFLESLSDTFRIHFAITGQYDFRVPFTLSMRYPVLEEDSEVTEAKRSSVDVANTVIELVKNAIGLGDDETLPADIVKDIINKYTFLDAKDIVKWTRDAKYVTVNSDRTSGGSSGGLGGGDIGGGSSNVDIDLGGGGGDLDMGGSDLSSDVTSDISSGSDISVDSTPEPDLTVESNMTNMDRLRERELIRSYREKKNEIYFDALKECAVNNFVSNGSHVVVCNTISTHLEPMFEALNSQKENQDERLKEDLSRNKKTYRYSRKKEAKKSDDTKTN